MAAFALDRVAGNFGIGAGATVGGFIVAAAQQLSTFQLLYFFDAVTYAGFALIVLVAVPGPPAEIVAATDGNRTGFRAVARDRIFLIVIAANIVLVVVGHTFFSNILPPFVKAHTAVSPTAIGIVFLVNTSFIVIAQIPAVRVVARMRHTHTHTLSRRQARSLRSPCSRCCQRLLSTRSSLRPVSSPALRSSLHAAKSHTLSFSGRWSRT